MTRTQTDDSTLFTDPYRGLRVVVTGGGSGIGRAAAARFLELGAQVAVIDLDPAGAPEGTARVQADISDRAQVDRAVGE